MLVSGDFYFPSSFAIGIVYVISWFLWVLHRKLHDCIKFWLTVAPSYNLEVGELSLADVKRVKWELIISAFLQITDEVLLSKAAVFIRAR